MKTKRMEEIERIYLAAQKLELSQRAAFLEKACAGDAALSQEVSSLLAHEEEAKSFIETPAVEVAAR